MPALPALAPARVVGGGHGYHQPELFLAALVLGLSHDRIARRLGKTRQAVQQNIHRGADRLRLAVAR
ncbi:sigma factor-like helix-turn-helix DNA-binding protein [Streptomyces sp. NPDC055254]